MNISKIPAAFNDFKKLPWIANTTNKELDKLKSPIKSAIVDILDGDLWSSKISVIGNFVLILSILASAFEVILTSESSNEANILFYWIYSITSILFIVELIARIVLSNFLTPGKSRLNSASRYLFSFQGIVDIFSILPFVLGIFGITLTASLKTIRILRVWRIVRFIPSFNYVSKAFQSKKDEIFVTFLGVVLLSLTISAFIFYAEIHTGANVFHNIADVFLWSLGKYTGDYGAIAEAVPISPLGKALATLNGLLGIAIFAIPAGLLGSAFIDQLSDSKRSQEIKERTAAIEKHFELTVGGKGILKEKKVKSRYFVFETIQARFLYSDDEILEAVRESESLRFRVMKSLPTLVYNDIKLIERYNKNTSYGTKILIPGSKLYIINPLGAVERCITHFTSNLAMLSQANFISREIRLFSKLNAIGTSSSIHYENYPTINRNVVPSEFIDFMEDIKQIKAHDIVLVFCSGASGRADFIMEYGNPLGKKEVKTNISTITNSALATTLESILKKNLSEVTIPNKKAKDGVEKFEFTIENHTIGKDDPKRLGKAIHRLTGAQVITLYINIDLLTGTNERYYAALRELKQSVIDFKSQAF
jgi:voltage-gated potassium channel